LVDCLANILKEIEQQHWDLTMFCNQNKRLMTIWKKTISNLTPGTGQRWEL